MTESHWIQHEKKPGKGGGPKVTTPTVRLYEHTPDGYTTPQYTLNILQALYEQMGKPDRVTFAIEDRTIGMEPGGNPEVAYSINDNGSNAQISCTAVINQFGFIPRTGRYEVERDRGYWVFELERESV